MVITKFIWTFKSWNQTSRIHDVILASVSGQCGQCYRFWQETAESCCAQEIITQRKTRLFTFILLIRNSVEKAHFQKNIFNLRNFKFVFSAENAESMKQQKTKVNRNNFDKTEFVCYKLVRLECAMDAFREEAATLASEMLRGLNRKCRNWWFNGKRKIIHFSATSNIEV